MNVNLRIYFLFVRHTFTSLYYYLAYLELSTLFNNRTERRLRSLIYLLSYGLHVKKKANRESLFRPLASLFGLRQNFSGGQITE